MSNIHRVLAETDAHILLRVHVDADNIDETSDVLSFLDGEGLSEHERVTIYGNTVYKKDANWNVFVQRSQEDLYNAILGHLGLELELIVCRSLVRPVRMPRRVCTQLAALPHHGDRRDLGFYHPKLLFLCALAFSLPAMRGPD